MSTADGRKAAAIQRLTKERDDAILRLAVARKGLEAVESLMNESHGVGGLHLNGDFAPWSDLRTGGWMEEWLVAFDDALNAARSSNPTADRRATAQEGTHE